MPETLHRQHAAADEALSARPPRELPVQLDADEIVRERACREGSSRDVDALAHELRERRADRQVVG